MEKSLQGDGWPGNSTHQIPHTLKNCIAVDAAGNLHEEFRFYLQFLLMFVFKGIFVQNFL